MHSIANFDEISRNGKMHSIANFETNFAKLPPKLSLEAKRLYTDAHRAFVLYRSMKNAEKRAKMEPDGLSKAKLQVLALRMGNKFRLHDCARTRHVLDVRYDKLGPRTPMCTGDQIELLCAHAGLAQAYQWVHLSELI